MASAPRQGETWQLKDNRRVCVLAPVDPTLYICSVRNQKNRTDSQIVEIAAVEREEFLSQLTNQARKGKIPN